MPIYLPIAELPVNIFLILGLGVAIGFISGMFGIGGGFLMTPLLILIGIPPAVAVASVPSHMAASSFAGAFSYWRKRLVDLGLGFVLLSGAILGTASGVWFFALLRRAGQLDLFIALAYIVLLTIVGGLMTAESVRAIVRTWRGTPPILRRPGTHAWFHGLPLKLRFRQSRIYVSAIPITLVATVLHAVENRTVDAMLALVLMVGGVFGAQFGARAGQAIRAEQLRLLLGLIIIAVGVRVAADLVNQPIEAFSVVPKEIWE